MSETPAAHPRIVVIDHLDSFTYNLVGYLRCITPNVKVLRYADATIDAVGELNPHGILFSPGPGTPAHYPLSAKLLHHFAGRVPILGVCLGHQLMAAEYGATVTHAPHQMHGKTSSITHDNQGVFAGLPNPLTVMRYHSLSVKRDTLPNFFSISAETEAGDIMGIRHKSLSLEGVQFHPESVLTEAGMPLIQNWVHTTAAQPLAK